MVYPLVRKDFPVGREWKHLVNLFNDIFEFCPKGLSRWKGMETYLEIWFGLKGFIVRKDFPVGREWKPKPIIGGGQGRVCPKGLSRWKGMETFFGSHEVGANQPMSERTFPLEGNGNASHSGSSPTTKRRSERTFPLEGNGNIISLSLASVSLLCPKGLSRWKGMETIVSG